MTDRDKLATVEHRTGEARKLLHRATPGFVDEAGEHVGYRNANRAERRAAAKWLRMRGKGFTR